MARDIYTQLDRCSYCGRPGFTCWDVDLVSCSQEVCQALAYGEVRRRATAGTGHRHAEARRIDLREHELAHRAR